MNVFTLDSTAIVIIPDYQTLMLPLLKIAADGKEHKIGDLISPLARGLELAESDLAAMLPSGKQTVFSTSALGQDLLGASKIARNDSPRTFPHHSRSLGAAKANKGVFVTTSYFTKPAFEFAERHPFKMVLIDGTQLTGLMMRHNVGVRIAETLHVKKIDEDFFADE